MSKKPLVVGVVGQGFVGGSLSTVLAERGVDVFAYDKAGVYSPGVIGHVEAKDWSLHHMVHAVMERSDPSVIFVCLPTPMRKSGEADLSIVEGVLIELSELAGQDEIIAVIKSTVPPGSTARWNKMFESTGLTVVFSPEFLKEVSALEDMQNQRRIIIGGPRPSSTVVKLIFCQVFPEAKIIDTSSMVAEMVKYFINSLLATKVSWANEIYQICERLGIDYDKVVEYALYDERIGNSHLSVPGPDGDFGFGGHCLPKDLNALMFLAKQLKIETPVMKGVWAKNDEVRRIRDWEWQVGRAVSED